MLQTQLRPNRKVYIPMVYNYTLKVNDMFTLKEARLLRFLMVSFDPTSINEIAKECKLSPNGAYKILKKLEKLNIVKAKHIGKIKAYAIDFDNELALENIKLALGDIRTKQPKVKVRIEDFKDFKKFCKAGFLFGSYLTKKDPRDLDVLFVFEKDKYGLFKKSLDNLRKNYAKFLIPYPIHDIIQTPSDITDNLRSRDKVVAEIIKEGVIMWGYDAIARSIKNAHTKQ